MKLPCADRFRWGPCAFTLAEVLAALALMAIVIPVALEGTSIASRAGMLGARKAAAARVAQRVLHEAVVTDATLQNTTSGTAQEANTTYGWTLSNETWSVDRMNLVTVRVTFSLQGSEYQIALSTLVDPFASSTATATSSTGSP